jgi:hypothetical protein
MAWPKTQAKLLVTWEEGALQTTEHGKLLNRAINKMTAVRLTIIWF